VHETGAKKCRIVGWISGEVEIGDEKLEDNDRFYSENALETVKICFDQNEE